MIDELKAIEALTFELFDINMDNCHSLSPFVRYPKDLPILVAAIESEVDTLITGDKDLLEIDMPNPSIMEPAKLVGIYG